MLWFCIEGDNDTTSFTGTLQDMPPNLIFCGNSIGSAQSVQRYSQEILNNKSAEIQC